MTGFIHVLRCLKMTQCRILPAVLTPCAICKPWIGFFAQRLIAVERKLERLADELRKGGGRDKATVQKEIVLFERLKETLEQETLLRETEISDEENEDAFRFWAAHAQTGAGCAQPGRRTVCPTNQL